MSKRSDDKKEVKSGYDWMDEAFLKYPGLSRKGHKHKPKKKKK